MNKQKMEDVYYRVLEVWDDLSLPVKFYFKFEVKHLYWRILVKLHLKTWEEISESISTGDPEMDAEVDKIMDEFFR